MMPSRGWSMLLSSCLGVLLLGCGPDGPPPPSTQSSCVAAPAPATSPALVLGQMVGDTFQPFAGGEQLELHYGAQGGTHFGVAVRLHTGDAQLWLLDLRIAGDNASASTSVSREGCDADWLELDVPVFGYGDGPGEIRVDARPDGAAGAAVTQMVAVELVDPEAGI